MKRNSKAYRLQLIKETVENREYRLCSDPMVRRIGNMLTDKPDIDQDMNANHRFAGHHYDESIDGWVSDMWK